ncbi:hypothetical protein BD289DRAFT_453278 [Coniella lustricola]|uniref:Uncharacterized protein n=1 Tax=Coniella lustricola TaxID=2025994 RepID=A0A2T3A849_9PEZI|nr:hypothetical protein BD289DRAFT_453278 [Coniella lustricola]
MSKIVEDVRSGLKGIKGAGDAIRGSTMQATDELFDQGSNHPQTAASTEKNRALAEKGMQDARLADQSIGSRHGPAAKAGTTTTTGATNTNVNTNAGVGGTY